MQSKTARPTLLGDPGRADSDSFGVSLLGDLRAASPTASQAASKSKARRFGGPLLWLLAVLALGAFGAFGGALFGLFAQDGARPSPAPSVAAPVNVQAVASQVSALSLERAEQPAAAAGLSAERPVAQASHAGAREPSLAMAPSPVRVAAVRQAKPALAAAKLAAPEKRSGDPDVELLKALMQHQDQQRQVKATPSAAPLTTEQRRAFTRVLAACKALSDSARDDCRQQACEKRGYWGRTPSCKARTARTDSGGNLSAD